MTTYQPKGGMCLTCVNSAENCSHLLFNLMPPLSKSGSTVIVRCTAFARLESQKEIVNVNKNVSQGIKPPHTPKGAK